MTLSRKLNALYTFQNVILSIVGGQYITIRNSIFKLDPWKVYDFTLPLCFPQL